MDLAYWAILAAGIMPVATIGIAKIGRGYNNSNPRGWLEKQEGYRQRADFAHRNHFEAFPFFAAAVLVAQQLHVAQTTIDLLACGFVLARIAYTVCYLADLASIRSLVWMVGHGCILALFLKAAA